MNPEVFLLVCALGLLVVDCIRPDDSDPRLMAWLSMGALAICFVLTVWFSPNSAAPNNVYWSGLYKVDGLAIFFKQFFLVTTFFVVWMSVGYREQIPLARSEFFIFPLLTTVGMMLLASAADFLLVFVALELVTISFYVLVAYRRHTTASLEAATKYLVIGGLSTAFLVYGLAFLFGSVGSTSLEALSIKLISNGFISPGMYLAALLIIVGIGFKLAAVPFHVWAPDVYQGAPTPVTAFLAIGSKAAGVAVMIRVFCYDGFFVATIEGYTQTIFTILAIASLILGSFAALPQKNIKRLLGYSSIGHAGFILLGLSCVSERGNVAVLFYLCVYLIASVLAFFIFSLISKETGGEELGNFAGLSQRNPLLAFALLAAFISMAGIPPLAGFLGKMGVLAAAWDEGNYLGVGVAIVCAVAGLYYYLGIVKSMYWSDPVGDSSPIRIPVSAKALALVLAVGLIVLGLYPKPVLGAVSSTFEGKTTRAVAGLQ